MGVAQSAPPPPGAGGGFRATRKQLRYAPEFSASSEAGGRACHFDQRAGGGVCH